MNTMYSCIIYNQTATLQKTYEKSLKNKKKLVIVIFGSCLFEKLIRFFYIIGIVFVYLFEIKMKFSKQ